jgi:hypothetical protein
MKRVLLVALFAIMGFVAIAAAQTGTTPAAKPATTTTTTTTTTTAAKPMTEAAKPVTLTGEVVDLSCFTDHGAKGMDHAKCAQGCITKGMPVGFLTSDGTMYVILGAGHEPANPKVVAFAGKKSTITGTVKDASGLKTIELASIAESK